MSETVTNRSALEELSKRLEKLESENLLSQEAILATKLDVCAEYSLDRVPKNSEILTFFDPDRRKFFEDKLRRKSIRTKSGIAVVTAITKPFDCPHGTCTFCPGGVRFGTPQSYTQDSPAASFGIARAFDPFAQVRDSINLLTRNGHDTSKVELILLGGTILAMPLDYQQEFVKQSYDALNQKGSPSLVDALKLNETAYHRCVGLTIETKPDWCQSQHIDLLLSYGATRVEIGVQSLHDEVLKATNRGHTVKDTHVAFGVSRDSAFKIVAHMMPGLPLSDLDKDLEDLLLLVSDERLKPDMLKIYPTLVIKGTALYRQYELGRYRPYELEELVELLVKFKKQVPPWLRIMRIQREIPSHEIVGGTSSGNLRQIVLDRMALRGLKCRCIRCRETGRLPLDEKSIQSFNLSDLKLRRDDYDASSGHEVFLSFENEDSTVLFGFLRLRIPSGREHRPEIEGQNTSLVRELHVYGTVVPVGEKIQKPDQSQHRGLGTHLLHEAEEISRNEFRRKKQIVISASGTREYYRKRGYKDDGPFVSKIL